MYERIVVINSDRLTFSLSSLIDAEKCPPNTFQQKGVCQLCPERTYQDRAGQTECRPCPNRPSVTVKSSEHYNSRCHPSRPDHASIVALKKLPNRKSSSSTIQTRQLSSSASGKLGKIAAAHTQTSPNHNDKFTSSSKYKNRRHHQHPVSHQQPYQLATGRLAVSRNSFTSPAINDTAGIVDDDEDPCSPNRCLAGGTCFRSTRYADNNRIVSSFKCSCRVGTKGIHCETPYCPTLYCLNGGTCHVNRQVKGNLGRDLLKYMPARLHPAASRASAPIEQQQSRQDPSQSSSQSPPPTKRLRFQGDVTRANKTIGASRGAAGLMCTYCASNPCKNGGRCVDNSHAAPGYFTCFCPPNFQGKLCDFTPCPTSVARTSCPMSFHYPLTSAGRSRKRHSCWIQTSTGRRQCYWPPHPPSPASKSSSPAAPLYEIA
ncbi:neurogenic locus notch homolog protein 2-like [Daphnia pulicaria]|uniref:neurogenic locus notch homolog protein 2-like n=1 Tax=Daphnia pulicaria TaxID=35523 RepID=UPI001EEBC706|nr:neurogenic locus notch homolog protein 2-like [Daphnia pulicaria]